MRVHSSVRSFIYPFIHSFIHPSIHPFTSRWSVLCCALTASEDAFSGDVAVGTGRAAAPAVWQPGRVVLLAVSGGGAARLAAAAGVGRVGGAGCGRACATRRRGLHGAHEQRPLPARVRLCPLLPVHPQRLLQGPARAGGHRRAGCLHHPLPPLTGAGGGLRAAQPGLGLGRQGLLPGAALRLSCRRLPVRRHVVSAEHPALQPRQDHAVPVQEEGGEPRVPCRAAALDQLQHCQQPGPEDREQAGGEITVRERGPQGRYHKSFLFTCRATDSLPSPHHCRHGSR